MADVGMAVSQMIKKPRVKRLIIIEFLTVITSVRIEYTLSEIIDPRIEKIVVDLMVPSRR